MTNEQSPTRQWHGTVPDFPELYDVLHGRNRDDIDFYRKLLSSQQEVLEIGIGTGRVAIPLAQVGIAVNGIDSSPSMLMRLEHNAALETEDVKALITARQGDMRSFNLARKFDTAIVPFMTFNYLGSIDDQMLALRAIRKHLNNDGLLVIELISMYPPWFHNDGVPRIVGRVENPVTGEVTEVTRITEFDHSTQVLQHHRYYRVIDSAGILLREQRTVLRNRFFFIGEAQLLLQSAGYRVESVWGDHSFGRYDQQSQVVVIAARVA